MLKQALDGGMDMEAMRQAYAQLEAATFAIAETMYGDNNSAASA